MEHGFFPQFEEFFRFREFHTGFEAKINRYRYGN